MGNVIVKFLRKGNIKRGCPIKAPLRSAPLCVAVRAVEVLRRNNGVERRFTARLGLQSRERIESKKRVRLEY